MPFFQFTSLRPKTPAGGQPPADVISTNRSITGRGEDSKTLPGKFQLCIQQTSSSLSCDRDIGRAKLSIMEG